MRWSLPRHMLFLHHTVVGSDLIYSMNDCVHPGDVSDLISSHSLLQISLCCSPFTKVRASPEMHQ